MSLAPTLIVICGPTAVGKTQFSIDIAKALNAEIISADSRQFFKELNIGTAKPTKKELEQVPHHFVGNKSISQKYNASDFESEVIDFLKNYFQQKTTAVLCGGSGMYINAVCNGFDSDIPTADESIRKELNQKFEEKGIVVLQEILKKLDSRYFSEVDLNNHKRLLRAIEVCLVTGKPYSTIRKGEKKVRLFNILKIGLEMDRKKLYSRINKRVDFMMQEGLLEEVKSVIQYKDNNALKTVGYKELFNFIEGDIAINEAIEKIKVNSRRYAKRQMTWFKKDPEITWFNPSQKSEVLAYIRKRTNESE